MGCSLVITIKLVPPSSLSQISEVVACEDGAGHAFSRWVCRRRGCGMPSLNLGLLCDMVSQDFNILTIKTSGYLIKYLIRTSL